MSSVPIPTFVINLDRDMVKMDNIWSKFSQNKNIELIRFSAVDGKKYRKGDNLSVWTKTFGTNKMIGCYQSHLSLYKRIVDQNLPYAIIFEDDVDPVDGWDVKLMEYLDELGPNFDLLLLGYHSEYMVKDVHTNPILAQGLSALGICRPFSQRTDHIVTPTTFGGTHAYMISRKGAQKLLDYLSSTNVRIPIDVNLTLFSPHMLDIAACVPPLIRSYYVENHFWTWSWGDSAIGLWGQDISNGTICIILGLCLCLFMLSGRMEFVYVAFIILIIVLIILGYPMYNFKRKCV